MKNYKLSIKNCANFFSSGLSVANSRCYQFWRGSWSVYERFLAPRSLDEDNRRKEFILNIILLGIIFLLVVFDAIVFINTESLGPRYHGISFVIFSVVLCIFLFLYILSRTGKFAVSSYILVGVLFFEISHSAYRWGVDLPPALLGYALVIAISSILIGTGISLWVTTLAVCLLAIFGYGQVHTHILPALYWKNEPLKLNNIVEYSLILFLIALVSWLSNREIEKSLLRARNSEFELKKERDMLEVIVERRTQELRHAQLTKVAQVTRFAEIGQLAAGHYHDLVGPLAALSLSVERLRDKYSEPAGEISESLNLAINSSKRMESFINLMRKQIRQEEVRDWFSPYQEVEHVIATLDHKARNKKVIFMTNLSGHQCLLYGVPVKFYQVALNLISNAIESYEDDYTLGTNNKRLVIIKVKEDESDFYLQVSDQGSGILEENIPKIFQPFFTTKNTGKSLGVGLSTIKVIIEKDFCGSISVQSKFMEGTTFIVKVPKLRT